MANLDASASVLAARNNLCRSLIKLLAPGKDPDPNMSQQNVQMAVSQRMAAKLRAIRAAFAKVRRKMSRADYSRYIHDATTGLCRTLAALNLTSCYGDLVPRFQSVKSTELYMSVAELVAPRRTLILTSSDERVEICPVDPISSRRLRTDCGGRPAPRPVCRLFDLLKPIFERFFEVVSLPHFSKALFLMYLDMTPTQRTHGVLRFLRYSSLATSNWV